MTETWACWLTWTTRKSGTWGGRGTDTEKRRSGRFAGSEEGPETAAMHKLLKAREDIVESPEKIRNRLGCKEAGFPSLGVGCGCRRRLGLGTEEVPTEKEEVVGTGRGETKEASLRWKRKKLGPVHTAQG